MVPWLQLIACATTTKSKSVQHYIRRACLMSSSDRPLKPEPLMELRGFFEGDG